MVVYCRANMEETGVPGLGRFIPFGDLMVSSSSAERGLSYSRIRHDGTRVRRYDDGLENLCDWQRSIGRRVQFLCSTYNAWDKESQHSSTWVWRLGYPTNLTIGWTRKGRTVCLSIVPSNCFHGKIQVISTDLPRMVTDLVPICMDFRL